MGRIQSSEILQTLDNSSVPQFPSTDVLNQQTPVSTLSIISSMGKQIQLFTELQTTLTDDTFLDWSKLRQIADHILKFI